MHESARKRVTIILQALLVTFIWSTSWVLIKQGLQEIPPILFAGLRYFLAFLVLAGFFSLTKNKTPLNALTRQDWRLLLLLGVVGYALTQTSNFIGLVYLPATTMSLLLNFTAILIAVMGVVFLQEKPTWLQVAGIALYLVGAAVYFYPFALPAGALTGYLVTAFHVLATSAATVIGRAVNRQQHLHPLTVTTVSMGIGSALMLVTGLVFEGLPALSWTSWA